ncbi:MAG: flagellar biosynthesis protein FlhB [Methylotenera sp.]|nr:flagellar biosynthesis protein FlhB [Oligoflexia bacterium]
MAEGGQEDRSTEDLSEEASQQRVDDMREKGQVSQSKELTGLLALLAAAITTYMMAPKIGSDLALYMKDVFRADVSAKMNLGSNEILGDTLMRALKIIVAIGFPISIAGFVIGVVSSFAQIGSVFSFDPIQPDFSKIDPLKGFGRLVSIKHFIESGRVMIKMLIAAAIAYGLVKTEILQSPQYILHDPASQFAAYGHSVKVIFFTLFGVFAVFAAIDFFMQRREWGKQVRLTKAEAKQEHKERDGDPHMKARIRGIMRDMSRKRMMANVKKADVIITNPTHIAIAISYDKENMAAPRVVAKGADLMAQRIREIAKEAGVPMVENVPLARTLYKTVKLNQAVPRALYQAVAEVLAYVYRLKNHNL